MGRMSKELEQIFRNDLFSQPLQIKLNEAGVLRAIAPPLILHWFSSNKYHPLFQGGLVPLY